MLTANTQKKLDRIAEVRDQITKLEMELEAMLTGEPAQAAPIVATTPTKVKKEKPANDTSGRAPRTPCSECGSKGARHMKTCSKNGRATENLLEGRTPAVEAGEQDAATSLKIKNLLIAGDLDDEQIAEEAGSSARVVKFIRVRMKARGEI